MYLIRIKYVSRIPLKKYPYPTQHLIWFAHIPNTCYNIITWNGRDVWAWHSWSVQVLHTTSYHIALVSLRRLARRTLTYKLYMRSMVVGVLLLFTHISTHKKPPLQWLQFNCHRYCTISVTIYFNSISTHNLQSNHTSDYKVKYHTDPSNQHKWLVFFSLRCIFFRCVT